MYEDGIIALIVVGLVVVCAGGAIIGAWVCPQTRPRRVSGYIVDDDTDLV